MKKYGSVITLSIFLMSSTTLFCVGGWNKQGYELIQGYEPIQGDNESTHSFRLKMNAAYDISDPNELNFLVAVRNNDISAINNYLKTKSFMQNASPFLFKAAKDTAKKQGNKDLEKKLSQF